MGEPFHVIVLIREKKIPLLSVINRVLVLIYPLQNKSMYLQAGRGNPFEKHFRKRRKYC